MSLIKQLREDQARIATEARAKLDEIKDDTPQERAEEINRQFDAAMADHDKIGERIEREEKLEQIQRSINEADERRPEGNGEARGSDEVVAPEYRQAFHSYLRAQGNVASLSTEERAVLNQGYEQVEARAQVAGTDSAGGYTVPTELRNILIETMAMHGPMYDDNICTTITTTGGGAIDMPTVDDTAGTIGTHSEGVTLTDDGGKDITLGKKTLNAFEFDTEWVRVSKALADDSIFAMESLVGRLLGKRMGRRANSELTVGSGSSAPNGIVTASSLGHTAAGTSAITADEIIDLVHSVDPAYRSAPKVRFMFNDSTLKAIRKLKDGDGNYLWQLGNIQAGVPGSILGYNYSVNQAMDTLGAAKKVMLFGDLGEYYVRKVGAPLIGAIQDKDFWPGFGVAGYIRFDGELGDTAAVKHLITAAS